MSFNGIEISEEQLAGLCQRWKVQELSLFGSVLREDFHAASDIDVLVVFQPQAPWSLWDLIDMRAELQQILGRPVDLVEKDTIRNPFRRHEILNTRKVVYAA